MKLKCGYPIRKWNDAKRQVREVLIERAKAGDIIPYVELTRNITAIRIEPQSSALSIMLREIAVEENAAGRGMLTAIVVYSSGICSLARGSSTWPAASGRIPMTFCGAGSRN